MELKTYIIIEVALQPFGSKMEPGSKKNKKCSWDQIVENVI